MKTTKCPICENVAMLSYEKMKGYKEGLFFNIYECSHCFVSFVDPLHSDSEVYDSIYKYGENISGYMRYYRFSKAVKLSKKPLELLSESENVYWGVKKALESLSLEKKTTSVLEIGSGLGYLTYALNKDGYQTKGIDISQNAINSAIAEYGHYYECVDLFDLSLSKKSFYDVIVMTELIEHVEDPRNFLQAASLLLKDGGKIIITTPNKNATSDQSIKWQNDIPPVHLFWFSEKSIEYLAGFLGKKVSFIDFSEYTKKYFEYDVNVPVSKLEESLPRLSKDGEIFHGKEINNIKSKFLNPLTYTLLSNFLRRIRRKTVSKRSSSMCVILS